MLDRNVAPMSVPSPVLAITDIFLLAGLVKGVIGLGLPTVAMGLLGLVMPVGRRRSAPSAFVHHKHVADLVGRRFGPLIGRVWPMMVAVFAGTISASGLIAGSNAAIATAGLGAALVLYAVLGLVKLRMCRPMSRTGRGQSSERPPVW